MLRKSIIAICGVMMIAPVTMAQYEISWYTIDGGGGSGPTGSIGGNFDLSVTIGQADAGPVLSPMIGGSFELSGGFWLLVPVCSCLGDMDANGLHDGGDIQKFLDCVNSGGACSCADIDGVNGADFDDVELFVAELLDNGPCP